MNHGSRLILVWVCGAISACTTAPAPGSLSPPLGFFSDIKVPDTHRAVLRLKAQGVQVFRCERLGGEAGYGWIFRLPEADLLEATGHVVGQHGANFSFTHQDGSVLVSTVIGYEQAPAAQDLRWLLLSAKSQSVGGKEGKGGRGVFSGVTHIQRVNTHGGMPPASCSPQQQNQLLRVPFSADFVFYKPKSGS